MEEIHSEEWLNQTCSSGYIWRTERVCVCVCWRADGDLDDKAAREGGKYPLGGSSEHRHLCEPMALGGCG